MSQSANDFAPNSGGEDNPPRSRYTYRDLKLLGQSSVSSPLRVITLIDFDCFYAQCESVRLGVSQDKPLGVQQFKHVIAINYAARAAGLKKVVTAEEAKRKCPEIILQHVPTWREGDTTWRYRDDALENMDIDKSSLDYYRLQSKKAMAVLKETLPGEDQIIERAGIDETYVDLSRAVHQKMLARFPELEMHIGDLDDRLPLPIDPFVDWGGTAVEEDTSNESLPSAEWDDIALQIGCEIVHSIRTAIQASLKYTCSAGIARNKVVAKLAAGHNKPNRQTVVRNCGVPAFLSTYKFTKIRGLGGKLGRDVGKAFNTELVSDLLDIGLATIASKIGHSAASWVYNVIRGHEHSEVTSRTQLKSVLSAKTFMSSLHNITQAEKWLYIFAADIIGRLEDLGGLRRPKTIAVHLQVNGPRAPMRSKQGPIPSGAKLDIECLLKLSRDLLLALEREGTTWPLVTLSVSVSDLQDVEKASRSIDALLAAQKEYRSTSRNGVWTGDDLRESGSGFRQKSPSAVVVAVASNPKKRTLFDFSGFTTPVTDATLVVGVKKPRPTIAAATAAAGQTGVVSKQEFEAPPPPPAEASGNNDEDEGSYDCPTCGKPVPATSVLEHLDWHAAMELSENG